MDKVTAPFTDEQVICINDYQKFGKFHPFTCCSPEEISECTRKRENHTEGEYEKNDGLLLASNNGLTCPCGKYTQDWCYEFMAKFASFDTQRVTMFRGLRFTKPTRVVRIIEVLRDISSEKWKDRVLKCRVDLKKKDYLPVFTPTGVFNHRSIAGLEKYNGIVYLDIDHLSTQGTSPADLKAKCKEIPWVYSAFVTPSGDGLKVLVNTDATVETYAETEEQVAAKFFEITKCKRDPRCKDIARIHYISYDPEILINIFAEKFLHTPTQPQLEF